MTRSLRFATLLAMACAAVASFAVSATAYAGHAIQSAACRCWNWLADRAVSVQSPAKDLNPISLRVPFVMAKAFTARLAKRERPMVTPRWRMCPSG